MAVKISKLLCAILALLISMTACGNTKEQTKCESCGTPLTTPKCRTDTKGYILCCKNGLQRQLGTIGVLYT